MGSSPEPLCQLTAGSGCPGSARRSLGYRSESRRQLAPSEPRPILVQIRAPDERDVAGVIVRGYYRHTDTKLRVYDTEGALLGSADLRPGDNVEAAARKPLKEKCGGTGFYAPISYSRRSMH